MTEVDVSYSGDEPVDVQPSEIGAVLEQLWRDSTDDDTLLVQVRTLNLLVFMHEAEASAEVRRAIDGASVRHPGRTIAMAVTDEPRTPSARVMIACRLGSGGKQICGEQINIESGDGGAPLPSIAAALLAPGVPTYLWWLGDPPFDSQLWSSFGEITDRLIVDSRSWSSPRELLPRLHATIRAGHPGMACVDLLWTELTPWRRSVAQCFDLPNALPRLPDLRRVEIRHAASDSGHVAALLLVGWLASRLEWSFVGGDGTLSFAGPQGTVEVALTPVDSSRELRQLVFSGDGVSVDLALDSAHDCVIHRLELGSATPLSRVTRLPERSLEQLVSEELDMLEPDHPYEAALEVAAQIAARS